jgi:hypothetical protein
MAVEPFASKIALCKHFDDRLGVHEATQETVDILIKLDWHNAVLYRISGAGSG